MEERQAIFVPMKAKLAFKSRAADLGKKLNRTVTQVEMIQVLSEVPTNKLLEFFK